MQGLFFEKSCAGDVNEESERLYPEIANRDFCDIGLPEFRNFPCAGSGEALIQNAWILKH